MRRKWYFLKSAELVLIGNDKDIGVYTLDEVKEKYPEIFKKIIAERL